MYKGKLTSGLEFYNLLMESIDFTSELGKVALASGGLEVELMLLLTRNNVQGKFHRATLGQLIKIADKNNLLSKNEVEAFEMIYKQRNYLIHNIYRLFKYQIDETILEREGLLDSDVHLYKERAWILSDNLIALTEVIRKKK